MSSYLPVFGALEEVTLKKMERITERSFQTGGKINGKLLNSQAKQFLITMLMKLQSNGNYGKLQNGNPQRESCSHNF